MGVFSVVFPVQAARSRAADTAMEDFGMVMADSCAE
jgi:hypothetical protein